MHLKSAQCSSDASEWCWRGGWGCWTDSYFYYMSKNVHFKSQCSFIPSSHLFDLLQYGSKHSMEVTGVCVCVVKGWILPSCYPSNLKTAHPAFQTVQPSWNPIHKTSTFPDPCPAFSRASLSDDLRNKNEAEKTSLLNISEPSLSLSLSVFPTLPLCAAELVFSALSARLSFSKRALCCQ